MARTKTPQLVKAKDAVLACSDEDAEMVYEWLEMVLEVRAADKERREKRESMTAELKTTGEPR